MNFLNEPFLKRLRSEGFLSKDFLENDLQHLSEPEPLRQTLQRAGISPNDLREQFIAHYGFPFYDVTDIRPQQRLLRNDLSDWLFDHGVLPFYGQDGRIMCACAIPPDEMELQQCQAYFGQGVQCVLGEQHLIFTHLHQQYHGAPKAHVQASAPASDVILDPVDQRREEPVDALIRALLRSAVVYGASDVHLTPEGPGGRTDFRVDGALIYHTQVPTGGFEALLNKLKLLSGMDIAEKRLPQEGRFTLSIEERILDVRTASLSLISGEKLVLRLLPRTLTRTTLEAVDFMEQDIPTLKKLLRRRQGLILVTGPTNSGKSTTLYALLKHLSRMPFALFSVEDPVEAILPEINQVQVNRKSGLDFPTALRGILREDPDVVMIGEIRDAETAQIAIRASLTGHLVLASLHAPNAQSVLERMRDLGVGDALLSVTLAGVVNQRLLAALCGVCQGTGVEKEGSLCRHCRGRGTKGRLAVQEVWIPDADDRRRIRVGKDSEDLRQRCIAKGFKTIFEKAKLREAEGKTRLSDPANVWFVEEVRDDDLSL